MSVSRLDVRNVTVSLSGRRVLENVTWRVETGEFVGLVGPNGVGKTTLLRTVLGLIRPDHGNVVLDGTTSRRLTSMLGYVPQKHHFAWDFPVTVEDAVLLGRTRTMGWLRRPGPTDWAVVEEALEHVGLADLRRRPIGELSGGQRQRILVARALVNRPRFLLLDEPFTGVDVPTQAMLVALYRRLTERGLGIVMSTHDVLGAVEDCSRICGLRGHMILDARPQDLDAAFLADWLRGKTMTPRSGEDSREQEVAS